MVSVNYGAKDKLTADEIKRELLSYRKRGFKWGYQIKDLDGGVESIFRGILIFGPTRTYEYRKDNERLLREYIKKERLTFGDQGQYEDSIALDIFGLLMGPNCPPKNWSCGGI